MRALTILFLITVLVKAQNSGVETSEINFVNVPQYFSSSYLNSYGITGFRDIATGFEIDPFVNIYSNPANCPELNDKSFLIYLDSRSQRKLKIPNEIFRPNIIIDNNMYTNDMFVPYPYYYRMKSAENLYEIEPMVSFGILSYPLKNLTAGKLFFGATFQYINNKDPYFSLSVENTPPYLAEHYSNSDYMSLSNNNVASDNIYNQLLTKGTNSNFFAGYKFTDNLQSGISLSYVQQRRMGKFYFSPLNDNLSQVNTINERMYSDEKKLHYYHLDLSAGISYDIAENYSLGAKVGRISGKADQDNFQSENYLFNNKANDSITGYFFNLTSRLTSQLFVHEGNTDYMGLNLSANVDESKKFIVFYRYFFSRITLSGSSLTYDTTANTSQSFDKIDNKLYGNNSYYSLSEIRNSSGVRKNSTYEGMMSFLWKTIDNNSFSAGIYYKYSNSEIQNLEPIVASQYNEIFYNYPENNTHSLIRTYENRISEWNYSLTEWTLQFPVMINFDFSQKFSLLLGINKIIRELRIKDQTHAIVNTHEQISLSDTVRSKNINETYIRPDKKIYSDTYDVIAKFNINLYESCRIFLLMNPDFTNRFKVAQWVLSFESVL